MSDIKTVSVRELDVITLEAGLKFSLGAYEEEP